MMMPTQSPQFARSDMLRIIATTVALIHGSACAANSDSESLEYAAEVDTTAKAYALADGVAPGWYGGQPLFPSEDECGPREQLAVGGDGQPMYGQVCVVRTSHMAAQGLVIFDNFSESSAKAVATIKVRSEDGDVFIDGSPAGSYTCDGKLLSPFARLYCASNVTSFKRQTMYNTAILAHSEATFTVNGYGVTSPDWTVGTNISN